MLTRFCVVVAMGGFSLVELMLALSLGLTLSGVMLRGLVTEGQNGERFSRLLQERATQRRALDLIKGDLAAAVAVSDRPEQDPKACKLAGRQPVLHLTTSVGPITYALGAAPSAIWRGQVLMRCGPAFGLDGQLQPQTQPVNRVVLDALPATAPPWEDCGALSPALLRPLGPTPSLPLSICLDASGNWAAIRLLRQVQDGPSGQGTRLTMITAGRLAG
jgi:type II secretory pathway pseudopilin PulG